MQLASLLLATAALAAAASVPAPAAPLSAIEFGIERDDKNFYTDNEVGVKRQEVDLARPGAPQPQLHDERSPAAVGAEQQAAAQLKAGAADLEALLRAGLPDLARLQGLLTADDRLAAVQLSVDRLQQTMNDQFRRLNATLESYMAAEQRPAETQQKGLVGDLLKGAPGVKQEPQPGGGGGPFQNFQQYFSQFQSNMQEVFSNFNNTVQGYITNLQQGGGNATGASGGLFQNVGGVQNIIGQQTNGEAGTQADDQTPRPTIWQSLSNIWARPGQQQGEAQADAPQPAGSGPFQAFQNNPIYQGVLNLIQRPQGGSPAKPAEPAAAQEGSNVIPAKPDAAADPAPTASGEKPAELPAGPVQQLVQNNPIVQSIAGTVQRLQTAVRPDRPRDETKLGFKPQVHGGHRPLGPNTGDSDNGDGVAAAAAAAVKDGIPQPSEQQQQQQSQDTEQQRQQSQDTEQQQQQSQDTEAAAPSPAELVKKD